MPRGAKGEKRPADVIGSAGDVIQATGEIDDEMAPSIDNDLQNLHSPAHDFASQPPQLRSCAPPFGGGVGFADALS